MEIVFNGTPLQLPDDACVQDLLARAGLLQRRVAVEVNGEIVPKSQHATHVLAGGDAVEIVHALGGG